MEARIADHHTVHGLVSLLIVLLVLVFIACGPRIGPWIFGPRGPFSSWPTVAPSGSRQVAWRIEMV